MQLPQMQRLVPARTSHHAPLSAPQSAALVPAPVPSQNNSSAESSASLLAAAPRAASAAVPPQCPPAGTLATPALPHSTTQRQGRSPGGESSLAWWSAAQSPAAPLQLCSYSQAGFFETYLSLYQAIRLVRSPSSRTKQRACSVLYRYIIRTPGSRYGLEVLHSVEHKWCASGMRHIERGHHASAPTMTKALLLGGYSISIGGAQAVPKLSAVLRSAAAWCAPMATRVGLCRVSFSVFSWVFMFVKAYFYVSTSTMVSQCVLRLSCKTPAGLTRYGYCMQHTWLWRSSALVLDDRH